MGVVCSLSLTNSGIMKGEVTTQAKSLQIPIKLSSATGDLLSFSLSFKSGKAFYL